MHAVPSLPAQCQCCTCMVICEALPATKHGVRLRVSVLAMALLLKMQACPSPRARPSIAAKQHPAGRPPACPDGSQTHGFAQCLPCDWPAWVVSKLSMSQSHSLYRTPQADVVTLQGTFLPAQVAADLDNMQNHPSLQRSGDKLRSMYAKLRTWRAVLLKRSTQDLEVSLLPRAGPGSVNSQSSRSCLCMKALHMVFPPPHTQLTTSMYACSILNAGLF